MHPCEGVLAAEVLRKERIGVNINNEGLKCQGGRGKGEKASIQVEDVSVERVRVGTACSCTWGDNNSVQHIF